MDRKKFLEEFKKTVPLKIMSEFLDLILDIDVTDNASCMKYLNDCDDIIDRASPEEVKEYCKHLHRKEGIGHFIEVARKIVKNSQ